MDKIKIVHVGLGGWGGNWATHVLPTHPDVEVVGWVEILGDRRKSFAARLGAVEERFHEKLESALVAGPVDAVTIAVPIALHEPLARQALEAGKHVVVEKPFTATMAEAKGLVELARRKGLTLAVSQLRLSVAEAMVAATVNGAAALALAAKVGQIAPGFSADLALFDAGDVRELPYWYGDNRCVATFVGGKPCYARDLAVT